MNRTTDNFLMQHNDGWTDFCIPVSKSDLTISDEPINASDNEAYTKKKERKTSTGGIVLTIQLVLCLLILTVAFVAKTFFADDFNYIKEQYDIELTSSMFFDGKLTKDDYSSIFTETQDEN